MATSLWLHSLTISGLMMSRTRRQRVSDPPGFETEHRETPIRKTYRADRSSLLSGTHRCGGVRNHLSLSATLRHLSWILWRQDLATSKSEPSANGPQSSLPSSPFALTLALASRQVEHETGIARVPTDELPREGSVRWCSPYSVDGEAFLHLLGVFSPTRQEIMGTFRLFSA